MKICGRILENFWEIKNRRKKNQIIKNSAFLIRQSDRKGNDYNPCLNFLNKPKEISWEV